MYIQRLLLYRTPIFASPTSLIIFVVVDRIVFEASDRKASGLYHIKGFTLVTVLKVRKEFVQVLSNRSVSWLCNVKSVVQFYLDKIFCISLINNETDIIIFPLSKKLY
jgi:hypothetical protein